MFDKCGDSEKDTSQLEDVNKNLNILEEKINDKFQNLQSKISEKVTYADFNTVIKL